MKSIVDNNNEKYNGQKLTNFVPIRKHGFLKIILLTIFRNIFVSVLNWTSC